MTTTEIRHDNGTVIDLKKVAYARFFYRNQDRICIRINKPNYPTVYGNRIYPDELALPHPDYPKETNLARCKRLDILDKWCPVWKATMCNGHIIEFTWTKARGMDKAWKAYIFSKKGKQNGK